jgi:putative two-component system response regulator
MDPRRKLIMLVDDNSTNLLAGKSALSEDYTVQTIPSATKLFEALKWKRPDLILMDILMPAMSGFEAITLLKKDPETRDIPVIFLTAVCDPESEAEGLSLGAADFITKPFSAPLLRHRIARHISFEEQRRELMAKESDGDSQTFGGPEAGEDALKDAILLYLCDLLKGRDGKTRHHTINSARYMRFLLTQVKEAGLFPEESANWEPDLIARASMFHDVGEITVPSEILGKEGGLSDPEYKEIKRHVAVGLNYLKELESALGEAPILRYAQIITAYHHEKWDGSGYPYGLKGDAIPLLGRLMAISCAYDALTQDRPYRPGGSHARAMRELTQDSGAHFDPTLIKLLERVDSKLSED